MTPPAVREAGNDSIPLEAFPAGTELITLDAGNGQRLRGVFVPAETGAPVVLHFLESVIECDVTAICPKHLSDFVRSQIHLKPKTLAVIVSDLRSLMRF